MSICLTWLCSCSTYLLHHATLGILLADLVMQLFHLPPSAQNTQYPSGWLGYAAVPPTSFITEHSVSFWLTWLCSCSIYLPHHGTLSILLADLVMQLFHLPPSAQNTQYPSGWLGYAAVPSTSLITEHSVSFWLTWLCSCSTYLLYHGTLSILLADLVMQLFHLPPSSRNTQYPSGWLGYVAVPPTSLIMEHSVSFWLTWLCSCSTYLLHQRTLSILMADLLSCSIYLLHHRTLCILLTDLVMQLFHLPPSSQNTQYPSGWLGYAAVPPTSLITEHSVSFWLTWLCSCSTYLPHHRTLSILLTDLVMQLFHLPPSQLNTQYPSGWLGYAAV